MQYVRTTILKYHYISEQSNDGMQYGPTTILKT